VTAVQPSPPPIVVLDALYELEDWLRTPGTCYPGSVASAARVLLAAYFAEHAELLTLRAGSAP
jgi:membrane-associated PAP2 superfamily phosphatase